MDPHHYQIEVPIVTEEQAWVCAARAVVIKDVDPWTVVGGNPVKFIKKRVLININGEGKPLFLIYYNQLA